MAINPSHYTKCQPSFREMTRISFRQVTRISTRMDIYFYFTSFIHFFWIEERFVLYSREGLIVLVLFNHYNTLYSWTCLIFPNPEGIQRDFNKKNQKAKEEIYFTFITINFKWWSYLKISIFQEFSKVFNCNYYNYVITIAILILRNCFRNFDELS